eukprot:5717844-Pyramimonas_sp.AAC.1
MQPSSVLNTLRRGVCVRETTPSPDRIIFIAACKYSYSLSTKFARNGSDSSRLGSTLPFFTRVSRPFIQANTCCNSDVVAIKNCLYDNAHARVKSDAASGQIRAGTE